MSALKLLRHPGVGKLPFSFKLFIAGRFGLIASASDRMMEKGEMKYLSMHVPPLGSRSFDRFVNAHVRESRGERVPEIANISVTPHCDGKCWHCLYSADERKKEDFLPVEAVKTAADGLAGMGTYSILLTGGDPLTHPEIEEIIRLFDDRFTVNLATPGNHLTERMGERLARAGLSGVFIGIDSADMETNDRYRGAGSYNTALKAIDAAKKAGLLTGLFSVIRREQMQNDGVADLMELARTHGIDELDLFEPAGPRKELLTLEERAELASVQEVYNRKKGYPKVISGPYMDSPLFMGCTAGFNRLFIDYDGAVRPCQLLPATFGNIMQEDIGTIWNRMGVFGRPGGRCLFFENYDILSGMAKGGGLTPDECGNICLNGEKEVPLYYRKLGIR